MRHGRTSMISFISKLLVSFSGFFGTVVLTRFLGKEQYGTYVVVISVLAWAAVAGNLGISSAVRKRISEDDGVDYVIPGAISQLGLYILVAVILWAGRPILNDYIGIQATDIIIVLLLVKLVVGLIGAVLDGQHKVHISSLLQPLQKVVQSAAQVALVLGGLGLIGAFAGYFIGAISAIIVGGYFARTQLHIPSRREFNRLRTYAQFSWFSQIQGQTFLSMDTIILAFFVTNSVIGGYKAAWNLASVFAAFSIAIRKTLFPEMSALASQDGNKEQITSLLRDSLAYSGLIIIPGVFGSALLGDIILRIYGEGFATGYYILILLGIARLLYGYQAQLLTAINALDSPNLTFRINVIFVSANLILNIILAAEFGWYGAASATIASTIVGTLLGFWYLSKLVYVPVPIREIANQILSASVMAVFVLPGRIILGDSIIVGILLAGLGAAIYFVSLLTISNKFRKTVSDNLPIQLPLFHVD